LLAPSPGRLRFLAAPNHQHQVPGAVLATSPLCRWSSIALPLGLPSRSGQFKNFNADTKLSTRVRCTVASHPTSRLYLAQQYTRVRLPVPELLASHDIIFVLCSLCYLIGCWVDNAQSFFSSYCRLRPSNRVATLRFGPGSKGALPVGFIANASFRAEDF
jgi:hypothetical protein